MIAVIRREARQPQGLMVWLLISIFTIALTACATVDEVEKNPMHSFSFDTRHDSPDVEVLDYQYGSNHVGVRAERERVALGQSFPSENVSGPMPRGKFLYVKWRLINRMKPSEYIGTYEDRVDLTARLPDDMMNLRVHFIIKGPQLYIYLISPSDVRPLIAGPVKRYSSQKQVQIYPDIAK